MFNCSLSPVFALHIFFFISYCRLTACRLFRSMTVYSQVCRTHRWSTLKKTPWSKVVRLDDIISFGQFCRFFLTRYKCICEKSGYPWELSPLTGYYYLNVTKLANNWPINSDLWLRWVLVLGIVLESIFTFK